MKWYSSGLRFECIGCGNCCAGPQEGDIWISAAEIELLARHLGMSQDHVRKQFLRRSGLRTSIREDTQTRDCIFLKTSSAGKRECAIYPVRPNQCRTWPFWTSNLNSISDWEEAAGRCPGIGRGPEFTFEQIEKLRMQKQWQE